MSLFFEPFLIFTVDSTIVFFACVWCHDNMCPLLVWYRENGEDKDFLSFIIGKMEWESPPSILVIRNRN